MRQSRVCKGVRLVLLLCLLWQCPLVRAQQDYTYKAKLDSVPQSGFYTVTLSPAVVAKSKPGLEDIRILDGRGRETPYILYTETARPDEEAFTEFPVSYTPDRSGIIISNILPNSISRLYLLIKNSEARRVASLSGSDDGEHWFIIKENIVLQNEYAAGSDAFVQSISFPQTSYKFFKVAMPVKDRLPLNIVKAGVYRQSNAGGSYDLVPSPRIVQTDSADKRSYIYLLFNDKYAINKLSLGFEGARYFKRQAYVFDKNTITPPLATETLVSAKPAVIELDAKTNRLLLVIDNHDNAPLRLTDAEAYQLHTTVTAYLDAGKQYALYFGDSAALAPTYDLQYFNDSIGNNIRPLAISAIEKTSRAAPAGDEISVAGKWLLWGMIIAVLLLMLYFANQLVKDINRKNEDHVHL